MTETIYGATCPICQSKNYFDGGEPSDMTQPDVEALQCWKCDSRWLLDGCEEWTTLEDANLVVGRRLR